MPREKSCGAVVFRTMADVEYLLLQYPAGHWDFVKGNIERNESEKETVTRELKEETGIKNVTFIQGFREQINYIYRRRGQTVYKTVIFLLLQTQESNVKLSFEHVGFDWLRYPKAIERVTFRNAKNILRKAHEFLQSVYIDKV